MVNKVIKPETYLEVVVNNITANIIGYLIDSNMARKFWTYENKRLIKYLQRAM